MLIGIVTALSVLWAMGTCAAFGGYGGLTWVWLIPVLFVVGWVVLAAAAFGLFWYLAEIVDTSVPQEKDSKLYRRVANLYVPAMVTLARARLTVSGMEKLPKEGRFMLVCNHMSNADPVVLLHCFKRSQLAFISKQENRDMFIVGKYMHRLLCQVLDRNNDRDALRCILRCVRILQQDDASIAVFPEGYIYGDNKLHHFRSGVFKIAQKAQVPIVVCTLQGTEDVIPNLKKWKRSEVAMHLVDVIPAEELKGQTTADISARVYDLMAGDLDPKYLSEETT